MITGLELGGAEALLVECADRGRARGFEPLVVSLKPGGPNKGRLEARGVEVLELDGAGPWSLPGAALRFGRVLEGFGPAVVQSWLYDANLFASFASWRARRSRTVWGVFGTVPDLSACSARLRAAVRAGALASAVPAAIVYNAARAEADHREHGYRARRALVFRNFVDGEAFRPDDARRAAARARLGLDPAATVAVAVGRNARQKSWASLLGAVAAVDGLVTLAVGPGTQALPEQANVLRIGPSLDMPELYAAADLFLLGSSFGEGTSVAMTEAMACGLPVVVTDVGDNGAVGREAGFATPPDDPAAFAEAIRRLVGDPSLRARLGEAARRVALERFSIGRELEPLMDLYAELCGARA